MRGVFHASEKDNPAWRVIVVFISLWELKFLAYLLNVTKRFVMRIVSYANVVYFICMYVTIAVGNGGPAQKLLRHRVHSAAQRRKRKPLQVPKESSAVCS